MKRDDLDRWTENCRKVRCLYMYVKFNIWDCFREKGPSAYIIKFPICAIESNTCVEMYD